jgi:hypothetical protein
MILKQAGSISILLSLHLIWPSGNMQGGLMEENEVKNLPYPALTTCVYRTCEVSF